MSRFREMAAHLNGPGLLAFIESFSDTFRARGAIRRLKEKAVSDFEIDDEGEMVVAKPSAASWWKLPDYGVALPELPLARAMREKSEEIAREAAILTAKALDAWSKQAGLTLSEWLSLYDYVVSMKPGEAPTAIVLTVTAKVRNEPTGLEFTAVV